MKRGLLIIMSGPSGVGKGTVRLELMKDPSLNLFYSISMTTRLPRKGETHGNEYYFVTREDFMKQVEDGNLLEWAEFVGNCYGTPKDKVDEKRNLGYNVLLEIDVNGTKQVLSKLKNDDGVISIFIAPPSLEELERRIRGRSTESDEVIKNRLAQCERELGLKDQYQYVVVNDDLTKCVEDIKNIIRSHL
ncbi:MAG TPA: guanylate kinase [Firmicutes bacterium]|nr:guanylate kinase [Bacillota bacterium]